MWQDNDSPELGLIATKRSITMTVNTLMEAASVGTTSKGCTNLFLVAISGGASLHFSTKNVEEWFVVSLH